jgi:uncharacterized protein
MGRLGRTVGIAWMAAGAALLAGAGDVGAQQRQFINIGTAGVAGLYYPAGGFVCAAVHRTRQALNHNIRCTVEATAGSVGNLRAMRAGDLDIAFSQSDWQFHAYRGTNVFEPDGKNEDLRFVMSLHPDIVHLVVRKDAGIKAVGDIKGKRINSGNVGSGTEATSYLLMTYLGIDPKKDLALDSKLTSREQSGALCDNKIDGYLFPAGVGVGAVHEAANSCDVAIVPIDGPAVEKMLAEHGYFAKLPIPGGTYRGNDQAVTSFGPLATIVSKGTVSAETIYTVVKSVFDNFEEFKQQSAVFSHLTREGSATAGRSVPYHPGAERYFKETKLIP